MWQYFDFCLSTYKQVLVQLNVCKEINLSVAVFLEVLLLWNLIYIMYFYECHRLWWLWVQVSCNNFTFRYDNRCLYCFLFILWDCFSLVEHFYLNQTRSSALYTRIHTHCNCVCGTANKLYILYWYTCCCWKLWKQFGHIQITLYSRLNVPPKGSGQVFFVCFFLNGCIIIIIIVYLTILFTVCKC